MPSFLVTHSLFFRTTEHHIYDERTSRALALILAAYRFPIVETDITRIIYEILWARRLALRRTPHLENILTNKNWNYRFVPAARERLRSAMSGRAHRRNGKYFLLNQRMGCRRSREMPSAISPIWRLIMIEDLYTCTIQGIPRECSGRKLSG